MTNAYLPRHTIEKKAQDVRQATGFTSIPVDPARLATALGIEIKYERLSQDVSGALMRKGEKAVIAVNSEHSANRRTFTLAHEIGHFFLHQDDPVFLDKVVMHRNAVSSRGDDIKEIQANQFAASLLMPRDVLESAYEKLLETTNVRHEIVERLARQFSVSKHAMELRLVNLALIAVDDDGDE